MPTDDMDDPAQSISDNAHVQALAAGVDIQSSSISSSNSIDALINEIRLLRKENLALRDSFEKAFKMNNPVESPLSHFSAISDERFEPCSRNNLERMFSPAYADELDSKKARDECLRLIEEQEFQLAEEQNYHQSTFGFTARERVLSAWPKYSSCNPYAVLGCTYGLVHLCSVAGHNTKSNDERTILGMTSMMRPCVRNGRYILSFDSIAALGCLHSTQSPAFVVDTFLKEFCSNKPYYSGGTTLTTSPYSRQIYLQWHLRYFRTSKKFSYGVFTKGIICQREDSWFLDHHGKKLFRLREQRLSLCVVEDPGFPYVLVEAIDDYHPRFGLPRYKPWCELQLKPCLSRMGVAMLQMRICQYSELWASGWSEVLDKLDNALRVTVTDVLSKTSRRELMYDGDDLPRSENYFTILQLLRVFEDMINQSTRDLDHLTHEWSAAPDKFSDPQQIEALKIITANWECVTSVYRGHAQGFLDRISRKTEEVRSLRDGLFNAQSVLETKSGVRMNRYLMVFTIVTIVYLPPTFAATFFGMHLFDSFDGENVIMEWTQSNFWKVFGGVTGGTYLLAALVLLTVRQRDTMMSGLLYLKSLPFLAVRETKQQWNSRRPSPTEDVENISSE